MDKEGANPDHLKGQLSENGLVAEDWGGEVPMIPVSAKTGFGIDELLEIILLTAEMKELKANKKRN
jgi:translation initiation factor IF-2